MIVVDVLVCAIMLMAAARAITMTKMVSAIILVGTVSLSASYLFLRLGAPDVAMTEAAIGSGLSTVIFLVAVRRTESQEQETEATR